MKILLAILFNIIGISAIAQNCIDTAFKANYHVPNSKLNVQDQQANLNGEYLLSGAVSLTNTPASFNNFIAKLNADGSIAFDKKLSAGSFANQNIKASSIILQNGNFLMINTMLAYQDFSDSVINIIKFDPTGNIIFAKNFFITGSGVMAVSVTEAPDGSIIILLNYVDDIAFGHVENGLLKIDALGNIIWCKTYNTIYSTNFSIDLIFQSLSVINNHIYVRGLFTDFVYPYDPIYEHRIFQAKIDLSSGNLVDSKSYNDLRIQDILPAIHLPIANFSSQVSTVKNQMLFTEKYVNFINSKNGFTASKSDTNLNVIKATYFSVPGSYNTTKTTANAEGEIFNYGNIYNNSGILSKVFIAKFDSTGNKEREISLNYANGSQYITPPIRPISLIKKYISVFSRFIQGNETFLQLYKFPANVPISECYGKDTSIVTATNYTITPVYHPFLQQATPLALSVVPLNVTLSGLGLISEKQCTIISDCNLVKINPTADSICNLNNEVQFTAHINGACLKKVLWQLDTSAYSYIRTINDTTIAIKFKKTWQGYLYAGINTCNNLKDSVYLHVFNTPTMLNIGSDTTLCAGASLTLRADIDFGSYQWQNGILNDSLVVTNAGVYSIIAKDACGNIFKDTVTVKYFLQPASINLGNDTTLCVNDTYTLRVSSGYKNYLWQDGSTIDTFKIAQPGKYFLEVIDSCNNIFRDTVTIKYFIQVPNVNLGEDIISCTNKTYTLNGGLGYKKYLWQDGSISNNFIASQPGIYFLTVTDSCGNKSSDTLLIKPEVKYQFKIDLSNAICIFDTATITLPNAFSNYTIFPIDYNNISNKILKLYPVQNTVYSIEASTPFGCKINDTLLVKIKNCSDIIYFPNAFTPNRDNNNDYFKPLAEAAPIIYELIIYNRYGQKIFETKKFQNGWDGKVKSVLQNTGSFVWTCKYQFRNKLIINKSGSFILLR